MNKILFVNDHSAIRHVIGLILHNAGYKVVLISHGKQALKILQEQKIDLIILDLCMPNMSGFEVLEKLQKDNSPSLKIIILSASDVKTNKEKAYALGADLYITQPVKADVLLKAIQSLLG